MIISKKRSKKKKIPRETVVDDIAFNRLIDQSIAFETPCNHDAPVKYPFLHGGRLFLVSFLPAF